MIQVIEEHVVQGRRLGRHIQHDPRSRSFAYIQANVLQTVRHRRFGPVLDQGSLGSCTGNAVAHADNTHGVHNVPSRLHNQADAVACYSIATDLDEFDGIYPPDDTGSSGLAVAKAAQQLGWITGYRHAFGVDQALSALQEKAVITGVTWYEGFDEPDANGLVKISGQQRGGHEFAVTGFEWRRTLADSLVRGQNSWGRSWGKNGSFYFTVATWNSLLQDNGDVTILDK